MKEHMNIFPFSMRLVAVRFKNSILRQDISGGPSIRFCFHETSSALFRAENWKIPLLECNQSQSLSFDGKVKKYLLELPFNEARAVFMLRTRMLPTKDNFKGRWGSECVYCGNLESDIHLFSCAGYSDLIGDLKMELFFTQDASIDELFVGAQKLLRVIQRLELFNTSKD